MYVYVCDIERNKKKEGNGETDEHNTYVDIYMHIFAFNSLRQSFTKMLGYLSLYFIHSYPPHFLHSYYFFVH